MRKLTSADNIVTIHHYKNVLEAEGIKCEVRNEHFGGILGEMPFPETWPQLWVVNDLDFDRARELIEQSKLKRHVGTTWRCKSCGELNEPQFGACWACGKSD